MSEEYNKEEKEQEGGEGINVRFDDFVARIVEDPNKPPDLLLLSGYLGASSEEEHVRLYLDEELSQYVEIAQKSIRHTQEIPPEQSPLGGSLVWIDRGAEVMHGKAGAERRKASFFEGQIAQDFTGTVGTGAAAQPRTLAPNCQSQLQPCILPTEGGPGCISHFGPCIPPTEIGPQCRTLTGILCTRFGPNCHKTLVGPKCFTVFLPQCQQSVFFPCITHDLACQASGFAPCGTVFDPTVVQQQGGEQFAAQAARAGGVGVGDIGVFQTGFNCPSVFDNCATQESFCPSQLVVCQSQFGECVTRDLPQCPVISVNVACRTQDIPCPSVNAPCPTRSGIRCRSQIAFCPPQTRADCTFNTARCAVDAGVQQFDARAARPQPGIVFPTPRQTLLGCAPSQFSPCQSQIIRCQSAIDACPTRVNCPSINVPCLTQFGQCETFGACPSAVDACPTRFGCDTQAGCFVSQVCGVSQACGVSQGCFPGGGGGFGGGGGGF